MQIHFEKIITGVVFGGIAVTTALLIWPVQENLRADPVQGATPEPVLAPPPPAAVTPPPVQAQATARAPAPVDQQIDPAEPVDGKRPLVAVAHEETTDQYELAMAALAEGQLRDAFDALRRHIYNQEPTAEILLQIASLGRQLGDYAIAEQALLDAGGLAPEDPAIHIELARVHMDAGDLKAARAAARQAIRLDKDSAIAWNTAGRIAMLQSEWHRAEAAYRRAAELDPTHPMIHNNLGLLYVSMKKPEQAVDALETAVELFGDEVPHYVFNNLGLAYEAAGDLEDARDAFEQALAANPTYSRARVNLERVLTAIAAQPPAPEPEPAAGHAAVDPNDDDGAGALVSTRGCASTELK